MGILQIQRHSANLNCWRWGTQENDNNWPSDTTRTEGNTSFVTYFLNFLIGLFYFFMINFLYRDWCLLHSFAVGGYHTMLQTIFAWFWDWNNLQQNREALPACKIWHWVPHAQKQQCRKRQKSKDDITSLTQREKNQQLCVNKTYKHISHYVPKKLNISWLWKRSQKTNV